MSPSKHCASAWPCAAASSNSRLASPKSCSPPLPTRCMSPSLYCASSSPCAAASPHSRRVSAKSTGPPSPL
eukprot:scaffold3657_cov80-Phaeocystis_antarctica.AAC.4